MEYDEELNKIMIAVRNLAEIAVKMMEERSREVKLHQSDIQLMVFEEDKNDLLNGGFKGFQRHH